MNYWIIIKKTFTEFINDDPLNYSASIAFYLIFSLPAILMISITIAGTAYGDQVVKENMLQQIQLLFGSESATLINDILTNARNYEYSQIAQIFGIGTLIVSATTVFVSLQNGLNNIWGVKPKPENNIWKFVLHRLLSLAMVISIGFILLVSLVIDTLIVLFGNFLKSYFSEISYYIITFVNVSISLAIITVIFALIFKFLPDVKIKWRNVWVGAFVTTLLFTGGKYLIGLYLGNSSLGNIYGAAGSLVLLLIWVYYSAVIFLAGAEFIYVYSQEKESSVKTKDHAVAVKTEEKPNEAPIE